MGAESPKEECGLFAVWAPGDDVARLTYFGLFAQQHRGQESAGIAVSDGTNILVYKVYHDGVKAADLGGSSAQSVILMFIVIVLTVAQFRFIERKVQY